MSSALATLLDEKVWTPVSSAEALSVIELLLGTKSESEVTAGSVDWSLNPSKTEKIHVRNNSYHAMSSPGLICQLILHFNILKYITLCSGGADHEAIKSLHRQKNSYPRQPLNAAQFCWKICKYTGLIVQLVSIARCQLIRSSRLGTVSEKISISLNIKYHIPSGYC